MLRNSFFLLLVALLASAAVRAQQVPLYGSYVVNPFVINPALAGDQETVDIYGIVRNQYAGFEGSPTTQMLTVDGGLKNQNVGLGLRVYNEQTDILRNTGAALTYAYRVPLGDELGVRLGVSVTGGQRSIDFNQVILADQNEAIDFDQRISDVHVDGEAGLALEYQRFRFGLAVPQLLGTLWEYEDDALNLQAQYQNERHLLSTLQYTFPLKDGNLEFEPLVLTRWAPGSPFMFDGNVVMRNPDLWYATAGYRSDFAVTVGGGVFLADQFTIGYAYDYPVNDIVDYTSGSHEVVLGLSLGGDQDRDQRTREDLTRLIAEERERNRKEREALQEDVDSLKDLNEEQEKELRYLREKMEESDKELDSLKNRYRPGGSGGEREGREPGDERRRERPTRERERAREEEGRQRQRDREGREPSGEAQDAPDELQAGNYAVVVASFRKFEDAVRYRQFQARNDGYQDVRITQSASGNWYFVYTEVEGDLQDGLDRLEEMERESKPLQMRPWLYKVRE